MAESLDDVGIISPGSRERNWLYRNGVLDGIIAFTTKKLHLYIVLAIAIGFGGGFFTATVMSGSSLGGRLSESETPRLLFPQSVGSTYPSQLRSQPTYNLEALTKNRPILGPDNASVTIVEFTDYGCPFCRRHYNHTFPNLVSQYEGKIRYTVINFPLTKLHPLASQAAEAAACAHDQGNFWEYHDLLFNSKVGLGTHNLKGFASEVGLDMDAFNSCLDSGEKEEQILRDLQTGLDVGVQATPTFFINGKSLIGARSLAMFQIMIDAELDQ